MLISNVSELRTGNTLWTSVMLKGPFCSSSGSHVRLLAYAKLTQGLMKSPFFSQQAERDRWVSSQTDPCVCVCVFVRDTQLGNETRAPRGSLEGARGMKFFFICPENFPCHMNYLFSCFQENMWCPPRASVPHSHRSKRRRPPPRSSSGDTRDVCVSPFVCLHFEPTESCRNRKHI